MAEEILVECNDIDCKHRFTVTPDKVRGKRTAMVLCPKCGRYDSAYVVSEFDSEKPKATSSLVFGQKSKSLDIDEIIHEIRAGGFNTLDTDQEAGVGTQTWMVSPMRMSEWLSYMETHENWQEVSTVQGNKFEELARNLGLVRGTVRGNPSNVDYWTPDHKYGFLWIGNPHP